MKKIYFLLLGLLMGFNGLAQSLFISEVADPKDEANAKYVQLYNATNADIDLSADNYYLSRQANGSTWADIQLKGTISANSVYVIAYSETVFNDKFRQNPDQASGSVSGNGDDGYFLYIGGGHADGTLVDAYGVIDKDGTGTDWEYTDSHAVRVPTVLNPNPNWSASEWTISQANVTDLDPFTHTVTSTTTPSLTIVSPANNAIFNPETTTVSVQLSVANFNVAQPGNGDGYIVYEVDNNASANKYDTTPIELTGLTPGDHHVMVQLVDNNGDPLNPAVTAEVTFTIKSYTEVSTLSELRAGTLGEYYHYTGELFSTAAKFLANNSIVGYGQDNTAGIAIYIPEEIASTGTPVGGANIGITDIKGQLDDYNGVLQIVLTTDISLTGNTEVQIPQEVTITDYINNQDNYESVLIKFVNVTIDPAGDTTFQANTSYVVVDGTNFVYLYDYFYRIVGLDIPAMPDLVDITGIGGEYKGTAQIWPIFDIQTTSSSVNQNNIKGLNIYPNPVTNGNIFITSDNNVVKQVSIYNITGKQVFNGEVENGEAINIRNLNSGVYLIKVIENDKVAVQKLMIK